ncbi:hypothetical protein C8J57DRAFT_1710985 [Mycena rebaudengoi]|nr:hypothetical protein C8J57DRAFT_1710985 [Mycena rebaudengoi]
MSAAPEEPSVSPAAAPEKFEDIMSNRSWARLLARKNKEPCSTRLCVSSTTRCSSSNLPATPSNLPTELLSRIFTEYALQDSARPLSTLRWTRVMLVCKRWHAVAITVQPLWSDIDTFTQRVRALQRLKTQLDRSGAAQLTVNLNLYSTDHARVVLEHSTRIRSLEVSGDTKWILALVEDLPKHEFRILRSLSLTPDFDELYDTRPVLPEEMCRLPPLRELVLHDFDLPFKSVRGLESLRLFRCSEAGTSAKPSFDTLLCVLESSPRLKTLQLELLQFDLGDSAQDYRNVELPSLEFLSLLEPVARCTALLTHLIFPGSTCLMLRPIWVSTGADIEDLLVSVRKHVHSSAPTPLLQIHSAELTPSPIAVAAAYCDFIFWPQTDALHLDRVRAPLRIDVHPSSEHELREIMARVLDVVPHEGITHLDTTQGTFLTEASWCALLRLLPKLEMVYIATQPAAVEVLHALQSESGSAPHIRCLHIRGVAWPMKVSEALPPVLEALEGLLEFWDYMGTPLERLEVSESGVLEMVDEEQWQRMERLVGTLEKLNREE